MKQIIYQVDAFTNVPFKGNPAGVCILNEPAGEDWMQNVAREMNLSETAFLAPQPDGFGLRWFTPAVEVDLCGHATLASAHILWETGLLAPEETARFHTRSGLLTAVKCGNWIEMNFPVKTEENAEIPVELEKALGVPMKYVCKNKFDYLVEVDGEALVRGLKPNYSILAALPARGVIVTSRSASPDFDFVSRFFAPAVGINEDPVTGSAHCFLVPYWSARLGKKEFIAYQASARGGVLHVRLEGDRAILSGQAVTVLCG
ncbi:MAG: PhzF family phenazine biosynthesis protein, partial [Chloroflexota bacterium]